MRRRYSVLLLFASAILSGCSSMCHNSCCHQEKGAKTLFEWAACKKKSDEEKKNGNGDKGVNGANGDKGEKKGKDDPANGNGQGQNNSMKKNGEDEQKNGASNEENGEEEEPLATDRPDFTEASSTVGRGRIQLESGYTFFTDRSRGVTGREHSYPEMLLRIGMFAEWFELRIGQNFSSGENFANDVLFESARGPEDLYLGFKLFLTEQKGGLPETSLIIQTDVPTGDRDLTADEMLPGFNYLFGWDIIKDCISAGGSFQINRAVEDTGFYVEVASSFTINYRLAPKVGAFTEWFAFYPAGAFDPGIGPEHYADGGFTYLITDNFQLDIRAGVGLNEHATNFFTGAGFGVRY